jgi:hypothetical protein
VERREALSVKEREVRRVLFLMKLARERQLARFLEWLAGWVLDQIPD